MVLGPSQQQTGDIRIGSKVSSQLMLSTLPPSRMSISTTVACKKIHIYTTNQVSTVWFVLVINSGERTSGARRACNTSFKCSLQTSKETRKVNPARQIAWQAFDRSAAAQSFYESISHISTCRRSIPMRMGCKAQSQGIVAPGITTPFL